MRVLFVDDDPQLVEINVRTLRRVFDADVEVVASVEDAVAFLHGGPVDLVITDIFIPLGPSPRGALGPRARHYEDTVQHLGGLVLLAFLAFHLAHLTLGVLHEPLHGQAFVRGQAYDNLMVGLGNPVVAAFYIVANLALGAHLWHGVTSGLQTLGVNHPRYDGLKAAAGIAVPGLIVGGNILIALGVLLGVAAA